MRKIIQKLKWYIKKFYNYLNYKMTGTIIFEGVGAVRGLKASDLVSATIITVGTYKFIEITLNDGTKVSVSATALNISQIVCFIEVLEPVVINDELKYTQITESINSASIRNSNKFKN